MRRWLAALSVFFIILLVGVYPANAAESCQSTALGLVCLSVVDGRAVVTGPLGINLALDVPPTVVQLPPVTVEVPGPTVFVPVPTTIQVPTTVTETVTVPAPASTPAQPTPQFPTETNSPAGQTNIPSATLSHDTQDRPSSVPPVPQSERPIKVFPHVPPVVAGGLVGLIIGSLLGLAMLYAVYRRGKKEGEEETLREFLGIVRDRRKALD